MGSNAKALKKLARSGWRQGKEYKKESNRDIRSIDHNESEDYSFEDARLELQGLEGSYIIIDELSNNPIIQKLKSSKPSKSVEKDIKKHLSRLKYGKKILKNFDMKDRELDPNSWIDSYYISLYHDCKRAMEELPKYLERDDLPNKLRRRIEEALE